MRIVTKQTSPIADVGVLIGRQGETGVTRVDFVLSWLIENFGDGTAVLVHQRSKDSAPYICTATRSGDILSWTIDNLDTAYDGWGEAELRWTVGGTLAKTLTYKTMVIRSITAGEEIPDPYESWYDQMIDYIDEHGIDPEDLAAAIAAYLDEHPVEAPVQSVNNKTGAVVLNASDVGALSNSTVIPTKTSDLTNDSGFGTYSKPSGGIPKTDLASGVQTSLNKADSALQTETDPTVPSWAKQTNKPTYTAQEVGALPSDTTIPTKTSDLTNDSGFGTYTKPSGGIPSSDMASAVQTSLGKADSAYQKPSGGIPATDLSSAVQTSLGKADSALQSAPVTSVNTKTGAVSLDAGDLGYDGTETYTSGTVGKAISDLNGDKAPIIEDTASGAIASFPDGADSVPVKDLSVAIEPVQDLHGQSNPYPPGGGKNLIDTAGRTISTSATVNTIQTEGCNAVISNDTVTCTITYAWSKVRYYVDTSGFTDGQVYTFTAKFVNNDSQTVCVGYYDGTWHISNTSTESNASRTVTYTHSSSNSSILFAAIVNNTASNTGKTVVVKEVQLELGSSATTYAPYENICPITGWTEAKVVRCGKNLVPLDGWVQGQLSGGSGIPNGVSYSVSSPFILLKGGKTYLLSRNYPEYGSGQMAYHTYTLDKIHVSDSGWVTNNQTISPSNDCYIRLTTRAKPNTDNPPDLSPSDVGTVFTVQLEIGSTATTYEPYTANTYTISLDGTRYGGTLDVTTGVLTVDRQIVDMGTLSWGFSTTADNVKCYYSNSIGSLIKPVASHNDMPDMICSKYQTFAWNNRLSITNGVSLLNSGQLRVIDSNYQAESALEDFTNSLSGIQLCYKLETQTTAQLTPQEITTLLGQNNIWSDTGNTTVEYRADTKLYINKVLNA